MLKVTLYLHFGILGYIVLFLDMVVDNKFVVRVEDNQMVVMEFEAFADMESAYTLVKAEEPGMAEVEPVVLVGMLAAVFYTEH